MAPIVVPVLVQHGDWGHQQPMGLRAALDVLKLRDLNGVNLI